MFALDADTIVRAVAGRLIAGSPVARASSVSIDSRSIAPGSLFAAFDGARFDAHRVVEEVLCRGAAIALVSKEADYGTLGADQAIILVDDMLEALQNLARYQRSLFDDDVLVVAITGSTGKTSTKDFAKAAFSAVLGASCATLENQNNELGLPLTILAVEGDTKVLVLEMGMRGRREIELLSNLARPHVAIITGTGVSHIERLGSFEEIARAKAEVFSGLEPAKGVFAQRLTAGLGVFPADDDFAPLFTELNSGQSLLVAFEDAHEATSADLVIHDFYNDENNLPHAQVKTARLSSAMPGKHQILNQALVLGVVDYLGLDLQAAADAMAGVQVSGFRYCKEHLANLDITLINDAYNANPSSMTAAIRIFAQEKAKRKIAVVGDMNELGSYSEEAHRAIGRLLAEENIDLIFAYGNYASFVCEEATRAGHAYARAFEIDTIKELCESLKDVIQAGDLILLKASRGLALEQISEKIGQESC